MVAGIGFLNHSTNVKYLNSIAATKYKMAVSIT
jgi:hypothetical protein